MVNQCAVNLNLIFISAADFLGLQDLSKWILVDCIINTLLTHSTMKIIASTFKMFDVEGKIEREIRHEFKANWEEYLEDHPDEWGFLLKIWPDFDEHVTLSSYESLVGLVAALNELNEEALARFLESTTLDITRVVKNRSLATNPTLYFAFETKYRSKSNLDWIAELIYDLPPNIEEAIT